MTARRGQCKGCRVKKKTADVARPVEDTILFVSKNADKMGAACRHFAPSCLGVVLLERGLSSNRSVRIGTGVEPSVGRWLAARCELGQLAFRTRESPERGLPQTAARVLARGRNLQCHEVWWGAAS